MSPSHIDRWMGIGLLGLPLYGGLTFWSSLDPQPDPGTRYEDWARFVTTDHYVLSHLFGSGLGLILAIFGTFALAAYLTRSRAGGLGLVAMVLSVLGTALFLFVGGVSAFAAPEEGQAYLAGIDGLSDLPPSFAAKVFGLTFLAVIVLSLIGNLLLGVAVWRSGILPEWAGALWALAHLLMYVLGLVYAIAVGSQSTPPTVPVGALMLVVSGLWLAGSVLKGTSTRAAERASQAKLVARPPIGAIELATFSPQFCTRRCRSFSKSLSMFSVTPSPRSQMRALRESAKLTQSQVAAFTGIPLDEVVKIECGEKLPTIDDACVISIWLDAPVYEIFDWNLVRYQRDDWSDQNASPGC